MQEGHSTIILIMLIYMFLFLCMENDSNQCYLFSYLSIKDFTTLSSSKLRNIN